mmetsp:Transcript_32639/g.56732  ORF Transcript_32639/g.56732 Transcript_32639/m.56732 type:complete len:208 (-) Transcript_32639:4156-4779(-)
MKPRKKGRTFLMPTTDEAPATLVLASKKKKACNLLGQEDLVQAEAVVQDLSPAKDEDVALDPDELAQNNEGELDSLESQLTDMRSRMLSEAKAARPMHFGVGAEEECMEDYTFEEPEDEVERKWTKHQASRGKYAETTTDKPESVASIDSLKDDLRAAIEKRRSVLEGTKQRLSLIRAQREQLTEKVRVAENQLSAKIMEYELLSQF